MSNNLIPANMRTEEERRKIAVMGGKASGEARRKKKMLKECFQVLLDKEVSDGKDKTITGAEALAAKVFQCALKGDLRAFEIIRDTSGQKPVEKVVVADVDQDVIDEVEKMVLGNDQPEESR